jgi:hypothetical protein
MASNCQIARAQFGEAISEQYAAQAVFIEAQKRLAAADARVEATGRVLARFEIDPEARIPQHREQVHA